MDEPEARITRLEQGVQVIREQCATKLDLAELKAELKAEITAKLAVVKADVLARLAEVEAGMKTEMSALRVNIEALRVDIERSNGRLFRWVVGVILLGQVLPGLLKHVGV
jgi:hypothetical protein